MGVLRRLRVVTLFRGTTYVVGAWLAIRIPRRTGEPPPLDDLMVALPLRCTRHPSEHPRRCRRIRASPDWPHEAPSRLETHGVDRRRTAQRSRSRGACRRWCGRSDLVADVLGRRSTLRRCRLAEPAARRGGDNVEAARPLMSSSTLSVNLLRMTVHRRRPARRPARTRRSGRSARTR
jgi:hypothetical protein